jgi:hypothetical protein
VSRINFDGDYRQTGNTTVSSRPSSAIRLFADNVENSRSPQFEDHAQELPSATRGTRGKMLRWLDPLSREFKIEVTALLELAGHRNRSTMSHDDLASNGQAETGALLGLARHPVELLEYIR